MKPPAWWLVPLAVAALCDAGLTARYETSPGARVDRAVMRTIEGGGCREVLVMHGNALDQLYVVDSWLQGHDLVTVPGTAEFAPGSGLTPQSVQTIQEGLDVNLSGLKATPPPGQKYQGVRPLVTLYHAQVGAGDSWVQGACLPFANPFQSHLRAVGHVAALGLTYAVFRGDLGYVRGPTRIFPKARVWVGVLPDGRLGFELVQERPVAQDTASTGVYLLAGLFTYPQTHLGSAFAAESPSARAAFYEREYQDVLRATAAFATAGAPPLDSVGPPHLA